MAFNALINSIAPITTPPDWVRPLDWITITDVADEVQFLVADVNEKAFAITTTFIKNSGTNIYIDWGDGVTDIISTETSTTTDHVYSTGGTPCSRGYNTFKIRIYGDATCQITNARHVSNFAVTGGSPFYSVGLLEAYFGDNTCNTSAFLPAYFNSNRSTGVPTSWTGFATFSFLEYVKLPATVAWTDQMVRMFTFCVNLYKVVMPTSASSLTDMLQCFRFCVNLLDITLPSNATTITSLQSTFNTCSNLRTVLFPTSLNNCTGIDSIFQDCSSLKNVIFPSIDKCVSLSGALNNCSSLQWVRFTSMPTTTTFGNIRMQAIFSNCVNLENVYFPETCTIGLIYLDCNDLFSNCVNLKNIIFPINFNAPDLNNAFLGCTRLTSVIFQSPMPNLTNMVSCFSGCRSLRDITLPSTVGASIFLNSTFNNCNSLESITIPSAWNIESLQSTFSGCTNITSIVLPNNAQNSCTSMSSMASGCGKLQTIVMPTSLNLVSTLLNTFNSCFELTSVTLPATMNTVTTCSSMFQNCYNLTSVTMPTSMTTCTNFNNTFNSCYSLSTLLMPSTIPSVAFTTMESMVSRCVNLKTLTLSTNRTSGLTSILSMLFGCSSLTTINNLDMLGSLTATPRVNAAMSVDPEPPFTNMLTSLSFSFPMIRITLNGSSTTNFNKLNSLRFLNASTGQWTGTSPQINISFCDLSTAALNVLFADIAAQGTVFSKTINITSCTGAAGLTAGDRSVLTSIGWTITG